MKIKEKNNGAMIHLAGDEVATAIHAYLVARNVYVVGPATIRVNGELCKNGSVYVDPSGFAIRKGKKFGGK